MVRRKVRYCIVRVHLVDDFMTSFPRALRKREIEKNIVERLSRMGVEGVEELHVLLACGISRFLIVRTPRTIVDACVRVVEGVTTLGGTSVRCEVVRKAGTLRTLLPAFATLISTTLPASVGDEEEEEDWEERFKQREIAISSIDAALSTYPSEFRKKVDLLEKKMMRRKRVVGDHKHSGGGEGMEEEDGGEEEGFGDFGFRDLME